MLDVDKAKKEIKEKTISQIHEQTAWTWASRAAATYQIVLSEDPDQFMSLMIEGAEFLGEALEHAAQSSSVLVKEIDCAVDPYMQDAWKHIKKVGEKNV